MNSFLLALTAVLILVLSALFAAPLFIDWNDYRPVFETQASKLLGRAGEGRRQGASGAAAGAGAPLRRRQGRRRGRATSTSPCSRRARSKPGSISARCSRGAVEARKIAISIRCCASTLARTAPAIGAMWGGRAWRFPSCPKEVLLDEVSVSGGRIEVTRPGVPRLDRSRTSQARQALPRCQGPTRSRRPTISKAATRSFASRPARAMPMDCSG